MLGGGATTAAIEGGDFYENTLRETGQRRPGMSALVGVTSGAIEVAIGVEMPFIKRMLPGATKQVLRKTQLTTRQLRQRAIKDVGAGFVREGGEEFL